MNIETLAPSKAELYQMYPNYAKRFLIKVVHDIQTKYGEMPERKNRHCLTVPEFKELREDLGDPFFDQLGNPLNI